MMNFRLARPPALVDITRDRRAAATCGRDGDALRIGALDPAPRRWRPRRDPSRAGGFGVLPRAARWVGHYPIRSRGTFGGSHRARRPGGRVVPARRAARRDDRARAARTASARSRPTEFFLGFFTTAARARRDDHRGPLPAAAPARRAARVRAAATATSRSSRPRVAVDVDGTARRRRASSLGGVGDVPLRAREAERAARGAAPARRGAPGGALAAAAIDPPADVHASADYRKRLAATLVPRALTEAIHGRPRDRRRGPRMTTLNGNGRAEAGSRRRALGGRRSAASRTAGC